MTPPPNSMHCRERLFFDNNYHHLLLSLLVLLSHHQSVIGHQSSSIGVRRLMFDDVRTTYPHSRTPPPPILQSVLRPADVVVSSFLRCFLSFLVLAAFCYCQSHTKSKPINAMASAITKAVTAASRAGVTAAKSSSRSLATRADLLAGHG